MLTEILANKYEEVRRKKEELPLRILENQLEFSPVPRDFISALSIENKVNVIAEIKKASPSHGKFNSSFLHRFSTSEIARYYQENGASAVSVLTDLNYFAGSLEYLKEAKRVTEIPVLRKDFIVDEYQLFESRVTGADAILLIVSCLSQERLESLLELARDLKMSALVEVGTLEEIDRAVQAGAEIIGINNRDLNTLQVDLSRTLKLAKLIPSGIVKVSESGINDFEQVKQLREEAGISAVLVGNSLVNATNPGEKIKELAISQNRGGYCQQ